MSQRIANKYMSLKLLLAIRENQYRSADSTGLQCYDVESVDNEINTKLAKKAEKKQKALLCPLEEWEDERQELKTLITTLKKSGSKFLSDFTLTCIVNDISQEIVNYK